MKAIVAVVCDVKKQGHHQYHQVGDKYLTALRRCADVTPILIPSLDTPMATEEILSVADAILFTGGYSNIERHQYGEPPAPERELQDPIRDKNTLHFLPEVIGAGLPMLGICRGLQELNVAFGGSLHPRLHEVAGRFDHRENETDPIDVQYGPAHSVSIRKDGALAQIVGEAEFTVNSVHGQGIDQLASNLTIEAVAKDGTVEAVSVKNALNFALAVQWHPEWLAWENPQSDAIFKAFGAAARDYRKHKLTLDG